MVCPNLCRAPSASFLPRTVKCIMEQHPPRKPNDSFSGSGWVGRLCWVEEGEEAGLHLNAGGHVGHVLVHKVAE